VGGKNVGGGDFGGRKRDPSASRRVQGQIMFWEARIQLYGGLSTIRKGECFVLGK